MNKLETINKVPERTLSVLSIVWGFSLGGVGKYLTLINNVNRYAPIRIHTLCILADKWWSDHEALKKLNAHKIRIRSRLDLSWSIKAASFIDAFDPHLIMTHGFNGHFVAFTARILAKTNIPFICSYHGSYHAISPGRKLVEGLFNFITKRFIRHFTISCVAVADYSKNYLVERGVSNDKITVIHNGIDDYKPSPNAREKLRDEWGIKKNEVVIGVASRLDPVKGVNFLVDTFEKLTKRYDNIRLIVIGSGTCEDELRSKVSNYEIDGKVVFTGFRSDVPACLEAMDIFVLPSLAEYHSIGLLEAMRAGKPIVATNVGGNTESVSHMKEGVIVPPANVDALVKGISQLLNDPVLANRLGKAAKIRFRKNFTEEIMVQRTAQWLMKCGEVARRRA